MIFFVSLCHIKRLVFMDAFSKVSNNLWYVDNTQHYISNIDALCIKEDDIKEDDKRVKKLHVTTF